MDSRRRSEDSYPELFPKDYPERLERLVEVAGLTWGEFAERLGVENERVTAWRNGTIPTGGEVWPHHAAGLLRSRRHGSDASRGRRGCGVAM